MDIPSKGLCYFSHVDKCYYNNVDDSAIQNNKIPQDKKINKKATKQVVDQTMNDFYLRMKKWNNVRAISKYIMTFNLWFDDNRTEK